jgi:hypothetical protein
MARAAREPCLREDPVASVVAQMAGKPDDEIVAILVGMGMPEIDTRQRSRTSAAYLVWSGTT